MTDEELDRRLDELSDADVREMAEGPYSELAWHRPHGTLRALAREVLRLRAERERARPATRNLFDEVP